MSTRYTQKDAVSAFQRILQATGERQATAWNDVGGCLLDYNSVYGGYVIVRVCNGAGGQSNPFGHERRTAREFWDFANAFCLGTKYGTGLIGNHPDQVAIREAAALVRTLIPRNPEAGITDSVRALLDVLENGAHGEAL